MRATLRHPDVRRALPWLAVVVASGCFTLAVLPTQGWAVTAPIAVVVGAGAIVGVALLVRAALRGASAVGVIGVGAVALGAWLLTIVTSVASIVALPLVLGMPLIVLVGFAIRAVLTGRGTPPYARPSVGATAIGVAVSLAVVALGVVDALVWLPESLAPGMSATEVHAALAAAGEDGGTAFVVVFGIAWTAAVLGVGAIALWRRLRPGAALAATLVPGIVAIVGLPWWQFGIGMSIGDTMMTRGGQSWAMPWLVGAACVLVGVAMRAVLAQGRDRMRAPAVA